MRDGWNPDQYARFAAERSQPFNDLLSLVRPKAQMRVVDLGCGTGELTAELHRRLDAAETLGIDNSSAMLTKAVARATTTLRFQLGDLATFNGAHDWDLLFSNAALHWADDHRGLLTRLSGLLRAGGQIAVQVPANHDSVSHAIAAQVAQEEPFRTALGGFVRHHPVLTADQYAEVLHDLGFVEQHVRLQVYLHRLASRDDVVEWVKGTLLTAYESRLAPDLYASFVERYRERLHQQTADQRPFPFFFNRILLWGGR